MSPFCYRIESELGGLSSLALISSEKLVTLGAKQLIIALSSLLQLCLLAAAAGSFPIYFRYPFES